jgi:hypothetical protein
LKIQALGSDISSFIILGVIVFSITGLFIEIFSCELYTVTIFRIPIKKVVFSSREFLVFV